MKRKSLSCLMAAAIVVAAMSLQAEKSEAGIYVGVSHGYVYAPQSYYVAPPVYYSPPPVLVTSQRYPYYAQPVVRTTYYAQPAYVQPVYYSAPVVTDYYHSYPAYRGEYKIKYRRGLFHESIKIDYDD